PNNGFCMDSHDNFSLVVKEGRKPGLELINQNMPTTREEWGAELIEGIAPYAQLLDQAKGGDLYAQALAIQAEKVRDSGKTPSARLLQALRDQNLSLHDYSLKRSIEHRDALRAQALEPAVQDEYETIARESIAEQKRLEDGDTEDFDSYVARYHGALKKPVKV